jgi:peptidoglycan/xylan/chitin deacetylase (PgdA/CDA1 family)
MEIILMEEGDNLKKRVFFLYFSLILVAITVVTSACISKQKNNTKGATSNKSETTYSSSQSGRIESSQSSSTLTSSSSSSVSSAPAPAPKNDPPAGKSSTPPKNSAPSQNGDKTKGDQKVAYLTFDDGPSKLTPKILDVLKSKNVKATFFVIGKDDSHSDEVLKRMVREGHAIGIHSWSHKYGVIYSSEKNFPDDFNRLKYHIYKVTGVQPSISRFPGGLNNTVCLKYGGHIMPTLYNDVTKLGVKPFDWNVAALDASKIPPSKEQIVQNVVSGSIRHSNAVILLHDTNVTVTTLQALPEIIDSLSSKGFTFKTLSPSSPSVLFKPS